MVRPQRVEYEGAYYHVMNRGQGRQNVYHGGRYYEYFLDCLEQAHKRFEKQMGSGLAMQHQRWFSSAHVSLQDLTPYVPTTSVVFELWQTSN